MSFITTINNITIPDEDILKYPDSEETLDFDTKLISDNYMIDLDNGDKDTYDDRYPGSFFFGATFYGWPFKVYDDVINRYIFQGTLKNIKVNDSSNTLSVEATNLIDDLSKKTCVYTSSTNTTPAEIIYNLLTDSNNGDIATTNIIYAGFQNAINIQTANSAYINISYAVKDNKNIIQVINEILRVCHCYLYTRQNLIYMLQWEEYAGGFGHRLETHDFVTNSYSHFYTDDDVKNKYNVAYDNAGTVGFSTGSDATSIATYGDRSFNVPNEFVNSTSSANFKILYKNITGAAWAGDLAIDRFKDEQKWAEFDVSYENEFMELGEQLDIYDAPVYNEPIRLMGRKLNQDTQKITFKCLFLNTPQSYYSQDQVPPDRLLLESAMASGTTGITIKFTQSQVSDWLGYKIYFSSSPGEWRQEICNLGVSPIDNKSTDLTEDGYIHATLNQLLSGGEYSFYVTAYDTSYNESIASNILSSRVLVALNQNMYCLQGDILTETITLDKDNALLGTVPSGYTRYDEQNYDSGTYAPTAFFESNYFFNEDSFSLVEWVASGDADDIKYQYRQSTDGVTFDAWSTEADAVGDKSQALTNKYFQIRFIFYSPNWTDADFVYLEGMT